MERPIWKVSILSFALSGCARDEWSLKESMSQGDDVCSLQRKTKESGELLQCPPCYIVHCSSQLEAALAKQQQQQIQESLSFPVPQYNEKWDRSLTSLHSCCACLLYFKPHSCLTLSRHYHLCYPISLQRRRHIESLY